MLGKRKINDLFEEFDSFFNDSKTNLLSGRAEWVRFLLRQ